MTVGAQHLADPQRVASVYSFGDRSGAAEFCQLEPTQVSRLLRSMAERGLLQMTGQRHGTVVVPCAGACCGTPALRTAFGLRIEDVPPPEPGPDELLVEVICSSANRTDAGFLRAKPLVVRFFGGLRRPRHLALGCEFAGRVDAVGSDVSRFAVGDRVFGFDDSRWGGHAEYKVVAEHKAVAAIPDGVSVEQAAAATEGAHYALVDLRAAKVGRGTRLFVHGATGAIGSAAVQLGKYLGAHVVATSTSRAMDVVSALGPDRVIDHERSDFTVGAERFDVVFDAVGKSSLGLCRRLLVPGGVYMSTELGPKGQNPLLALAAPLSKLVGARRVLFPIPAYSQDDIEFLGHRLADGDFAPVIDRSYPLDQIVEALEYVETGQKLGNVIIRIMPSS